MQMTALLQAIMTEENTPAVGPTGNMVAGWRDLDGKENELVQLPCAAWDPNLIVIQEGSSSSDKEQD